MKTPETSRLFTSWRNPANGVESFILSERLAPVQKHFYYTNRSMTRDGRHLWVVCMFPPKGGRNAVPIMGVVDFERDEFRIRHDIQPSHTSSLVDEGNGGIYWFNDTDLWTCGPEPDAEPRKLNSFPPELAARRKPDRMATHSNFFADRKRVNIDAIFGEDMFLGDMPLDGGPVRVWQKFNRFYDHALTSPTDPDVMMFAHEFWQEHIDEPFEPEARPYHRLWIIRRGEEARPILRAPVSHSGHEWWDADGKHVWYLHYGVGVKRVDVATGGEELVWPGHLSHAHCSRDGALLVADAMGHPHNPECNVIFRNTRTGKEVELVNRPPLDPSLTQCVHLHPHPQFCCDDRYICYMTTVHDRVDLALARVDDLVRLTT